MQDLQNYSLNGADKDAKFGEMAQEIEKLRAENLEKINVIDQRESKIHDLEGDAL